MFMFGIKFWYGIQNIGTHNKINPMMWQKVFYHIISLTKIGV